MNPPLRSRLRFLDDTNAAIVSNTTSLVGSTVIGSGLGFVYWWAAARTFSATAVGLASAGISAMTFLATVGILGLGTLLMGELPKRPSETRPLIATSLVVATGTGCVLGALFGLSTPYLGGDFATIGREASDITLFAAGVGLAGATIVLDQAFFGLLRGWLRLWRTTIFAFVKLVALIPAYLWLDRGDWSPIYVTWAFGNAASLLLIALYSARGSISGMWCRPRFSLIKELQGTALSHHVLNLTLQSTGLLLPLVVTAVLSARMNAAFYAAWMIANLVFIGVYSLADVLYTVGSGDPAAMAQRMRFTLGVSLVVGVIGSAGLAIFGEPLLGLFGTSYADQGGTTIRIIGLGIFPAIINAHFIVIRRIQRKILSTALIFAGATGLELGLGAFGAQLAGLTGLSMGWLIGVALIGMFTAPLVFKTASRKPTVRFDEEGPNALLTGSAGPATRNRPS
jgi:O-antigen/teichoic acid export membrane protein